MDVRSITEYRVQEYLRKLPSQLDKVIDLGKEIEAADAEEEEAEQATCRRGDSSSVSIMVSTSIVQGEAEPGTAVLSRDRSARERALGQKFGMTDRVRMKEKATVVRDHFDGSERSTTFGASTAMFKGGRIYRKYPHSDDQNWLHVRMGASKCMQNINRQLQRARGEKYDADVAAIAHLEVACEEAVEKQADGQRLRIGRIGTQDQWVYSGELRRRNQLANWKWDAGFYVLCDGMLYEFAVCASALGVRSTRMCP